MGNQERKPHRLLVRRRTAAKLLDVSISRLKRLERSGRLKASGSLAAAMCTTRMPRSRGWRAGRPPMIERYRSATARQPRPTLDVDPEAHRFLTALDPEAEAFCFQTFDDNPDRQLRDKKLAHEQYCSLAKATEWLTRANAQHAGVFVCLNETDGRGRKKENITRVRALMLDLDGAPLDPVLKCALKPHIVTETSEGHFHVFWRVEGLALDEFEAVQRGLAKRFDGDPAVATLERCTRLPGFYHSKDIENRFRVRIVEINDHPSYTAEQIKKEFPPEKKAHRAAASLLVLPPGAPLVAAEKFVELCHTDKNGVRLLRHYRGAFYVRTATHWREYPEEALERELYSFLSTAVVQKPKGEVVPFNPTKHKIGEIVHALKRGTLIPRDWEMPCWLEPEYKPADGELVACRNGILNLATRELIPHDPRFFTTNCLPLDYDRKAPEPKRWIKFLEELWPADDDGTWDAEAEETLQEIFGYLLTSDTRQQKLFLIKGPKRAGKGTLVFVLEQLLGQDNVTYQTLNSMTGEFGRWPLIDKKLAVIADARLGSRNTSAVTETLLSISGGDPQTVNRKNQAFWTGRLQVRFLITTNVLPELRDASRTIASRFILLDLTESFYGREDVALKDKLMPELPGILNWALDGLDRLRGRGHFRQPTSSKETLRLLEDLAAPVGAFVRDWCERGPELSVPTKALYRAYKTWAGESGHRAVANNTFGKELRDVMPRLAYRGAGASRTYVGIALSAHGADELETLLQERGRGS